MVRFIEVNARGYYVARSLEGIGDTASRGIKSLMSNIPYADGDWA